jgi:hypothetical protein
LTGTARTGACALAALVAACTADGQGPDRCEGIAVAALGAAERKLAGEATPYPADGLLRGREAELAGSQQARRAAGWAVAARALAPVELAHGDELAAAPATVPRWQTWYGGDDVERLFQHLYRALPGDQQVARVRFPDEDLDAAFGWNPHAVDAMASWPEDRWLAYLDGIDTASEIGGALGVGRAAYAPGAARHLLASYREAVACLEGLPPPAYADGPGPGPRHLVREPLVLAACERRLLGPYAAGGAGLVATLEAGAAGDGELAVRAGSADAAPTCRAAGGEPCAAPAGATWIEVAAGPDGYTGAVGVDLEEADPAWAACVAGPFPLDAAVVKADWRRAGIGEPFPTYDTSADGLARRLGPGGDPSWGDGDGTAEPGPDEIYTVTLPSGAVFRLAALHVMTKELDHWMWTTLWWSPEPATDFGEDRPGSIAGLGGPWAHYKMCAVTAFTEGDPDPRGGAGDGSLGRALAAARAGTGDTPWCSNPYLERGHGNAASTCVGCHQHGGSGADSADIVTDGVRFPDGGRAAARNNFPADYAWALDDGDGFAQTFRDEVDYWTRAATAR